MKAAAKRLLLLFLTLAVSTARYADAQEIRGRVVSSDGGKAVEFAHVADSVGRLLAVCDLEGRFLAPAGHKTLVFSSVGFIKKRIHPDEEQTFLLVSLDPSLEELGEVVVKAGENPAHRIIRNARENLARNAPSSLQSYQLERYDRLVIGADSGSKLPDARLEQHLQTFDLLIMESIVKEHFTSSGGKTTEVTANRVSGLRDPVFIFLMDQLHSADFYGDRISIGGSWYVSPLAAGSPSRYRLILEESIPVSETDSLFAISFEPRPESRFDGLRGRISIQSPDWAIRSVVATPAIRSGNITAELRQLYEKIDNTAWFPVLLNTRLRLTVPTAAGSTTLAGEGLSQAVNILVNKEIATGRRMPYELVVRGNAWQANEAHWQSMRPDSLSQRLLETYRFMDSIGRVHRLDRWLSLSTALAEGRLRLGAFDFPINSLLRFNNTEGYRPGLEVITNERYSRAFSLGFFGGYATRIRKPLWSLEARYNMLKWTGVWIELSIYDKHEARESGLSDEQKGLLNPFAFRQLFYSSINNLQGYKASLNIPVGRITGIRPAFARETIGALYNDGNLSDGAIQANKALVTTISLAFRLAPGERFMFSERGLTRLSEPNPLLLAELRRMLIAMAGNEPYQAYQLRVSIDYSISYPFAGQTLMRLETGLTDRMIPALLQYQLPGSYNKYFLYAPFSFGSLEPGAYQSPGFVSLYLLYKMLPLRPATKKFRPQPVILHNMALQALPWKQLRDLGHDPYFSHPLIESGILFTNLLKAGSANLGAGFIYRWNLNQEEVQPKRIIFKLAFSFNNLAN